MGRSILLLAVVGVLAFAACSDDNSGSVSDAATSPDKRGDGGSIKPPVCIAPPCPPTFDGPVAPCDGTVEGDAKSPDAKKLPPDTGLPQPDMCPPFPDPTKPVVCMGNSCGNTFKVHPQSCFFAYCGGLTEHHRVPMISCVNQGSGK